MNRFNWATRSRAWKVVKKWKEQGTLAEASIGPRALARGKRFLRSRVRSGECCFNWATRSRAWKGFGTSLTRGSAMSLQLGHALSRVESKFGKFRRSGSLESFNWATRSRAWKEHSTFPLTIRRNALQLGHALSRVESADRYRDLHRSDRASIGPRALARGKLDAIHLGAWSIDASIGPRALARGKTRRKRGIRATSYCFNWATRSRAWKEVEFGRKDHGAAGFNWATRSRAWKGAAQSFDSGDEILLQLGHALSRVERNSPRNSRPGRNWLQLGHALSRVERAPVLTSHLTAFASRFASGSSFTALTLVFTVAICNLTLSLQSE